MPAETHRSFLDRNNSISMVGGTFFKLLLRRRYDFYDSVLFGDLKAMLSQVSWKHMSLILKSKILVKRKQLICHYFALWFSSGNSTCEGSFLTSISSRCWVALQPMDGSLLLFFRTKNSHNLIWGSLLGDVIPRNYFTKNWKRSSF